MTCSSTIFIGDLLWFFVLSSGNSPNIMQWSKIVLVFLSEHESFLVLYIWEALLYFDHCENSKKMFYYLFILARICFVLYAPQYCRHLYQSRNHLMNSCLHLSFASRIPYYHYVKSHILWCFQINNFLNELLSVIFRVFHCWK